MSASGIRDLSPEELALISGGAQVDTNDLPPVGVRPPDDWGPNPDPPDWGSIRIPTHSPASSTWSSASSKAAPEHRPPGRPGGTIRVTEELTQ